MWACETELRELARTIEPSVAQKSAASRSHNYLLDLLNTGQFGNRLVDAYLSGSYARDTAISPIDDVDVIVVVDPNGWRQSMWSGNPAPDRILQSFATAIRYRYAASSVHVQRRSVCLELNHLDIDVVPAIAVSGGPHRVMIPDASSGEWIVSAPKVHTILATGINKTHGGRFKPLVKLLKYWNSQLPETARLKSFAIETMAATLFHKVDLPDLQEGLRRFFDFAASFADSAVIYRWPDRYGMSLGWWTQEIPDLAGTGSNLLASADYGRCEKFLAAAVRSRDALLRADNARTKESAVGHLRSALRMS